MRIYRTPNAAVFDYSDEVILGLRAGMSAAVRKTIFDFQADAQSRLYKPHHGLDTGFLKSSIYTVTHNSSTYGQNLQGEGALLPQIDKPTSDLEAFAAAGANYAAYVNYGTSRMAAVPFWEPAFDRVKGSFEEAVRQLSAAAGARLTSITSSTSEE